jgi:hypothetical protein
MKGLVKLHQIHAPIRRIVNARNTPSYNLGKFISKFLHDVLELPYSYNVKNSIQLINDLSNVQVDTNARMCSFDTSNMFTNVPQVMVITIIKAVMHNKDIELKVINNTISIIKIIFEQNYFKHNDKFYKQTFGLAMGAPTSSIFSEIFL